MSLIPLICLKHQQPVIFYKGKANDESKQALCAICIQIQFADDEEIIFPQQIREKKLIQINNSIDESDPFRQGLIIQRNMVTTLTKVEQIILDHISFINNQKTEIRKQLLMNSYSSIKTTELKCNEQKQFRNGIKQQINLVLLKLQNNTNLEQLKEILDSIDKKNEININFQYQLIKSNKLKTTCWSFVFNKDATILFAGLDDGKIAVYNFNNGKNQQLIQTLCNHTQDVCCLIYLNQSNTLISAGDDKQIIIWSLNSNQQWIPVQTLSTNPVCVFSMISNQAEDLLITGRQDQTIQFWQKTSNGWHSQQIINVGFEVCCLNFDISQKKIFSCGRENVIQIIHCQWNQSWNIFQTIKVDQFGLRLCLINDNQFAFQPFKKDYLEIFGYQQEKNLFTKIYQIQLQNSGECAQYFPCQYINQKNILLVKHGQFVNIFGVNKQSIKFESFWLFGRLSVDGNFLVTYDWESKEIKSRQLRYLS